MVKSESHYERFADTPIRFSLCSFTGKNIRRPFGTVLVVAATSASAGWYKAPNMVCPHGQHHLALEVLNTIIKTIIKAPVEPLGL